MEAMQIRSVAKRGQPTECIVCDPPLLHEMVRVVIEDYVDLNRNDVLDALRLLVHKGYVMEKPND